MKYVVYHQSYGCDTGCCGHVITVENDDGSYVDSDWTFYHCYGKTYGAPTDEEKRAWAEKLLIEAFGGEHVADLDWENCLILDD